MIMKLVVIKNLTANVDQAMNKVTGKMLQCAYARNTQ